MEITQENRNYEFPVVLVESVHEKKKSFDKRNSSLMKMYKNTKKSDK